MSYESTDQLYKAIESLRAAVTEGFDVVRTEIGEVKTDFRAKIADVKTELLAELKAEISGLQGELKTEISGLWGELKGDGIDIRAELARTRADILARVDRLQDSQTLQFDDIGVNYHAAVRASDSVKALRDELFSLGSQVNAMERQIIHLQSEVRDLRKGP